MYFFLSRNETDGVNSPIRQKSFQIVDNGNSVFDSNDNKEMGKRSNLLDYYISLETATQKQKKIPAHQTFSNLDSSVPMSPTPAHAKG